MKWVQCMRRERSRPHMAFQIVVSPSSMRTVTASACVLFWNIDEDWIYLGENDPTRNEKSTTIPDSNENGDGVATAAAP